MKTNEIRQRERDHLLIKTNTKKGYMKAYDGDGIDLGLNRKNHRGSVQRGLCHTIKAGLDVGVVIEDKSDRKSQTERKA